MTVTVNTVNIPPKTATWSIDELAQLAGVPSRTIREYRTIGLLAPPRKVGRVGVYVDEHLRRLALIGRMQARGYSLAGIRDLLDAWSSGESLDDVIGDSGFDEATQSLTDEVLIRRVPALADPQALAAAVAAGLIHRGSDGDWHVRAPSLLTLIAEAINAGAPHQAALQVAATMRDGARIQAEQLAAVFVDQLWTGGDRDELARLGRRARVLAARSASALLVDEIGAALHRHATAQGDAGLTGFVTSMQMRGADRRVSTVGDVPGGSR